jgi:hypothetical protein
MVKGPPVIVTEVVAWTLFEAALLAVTLIFWTLPPVGAVNKPPGVIVPALADHVTAGLPPLLPVAENCTFPPGATDGSDGEIRMASHLGQGSTARVKECEAVA